MPISVNILDARILIVDDQAANVQLLEQLLGSAGYTQVSATMKPEEVCALHRKNAYDLILLDLQMPVMDGFQVMEGLKTSATDDYLPVIVLTAQAGHKLRALQAGAKDFISKPFDLVEVKTRIHNMLEVRLLYKNLRSSEQRFRHFFEANSSVMLLLDPVTGCIVDANLSAIDFYGYPVQTLMGMAMSQINTLSPAHIASEMQRAMHAQCNYFLFTHRLASAAQRFVEVYATSIEHTGCPLLLTIVHDITTRHLLEDKVHHMAFYDALTQLPNRRLMVERLTQTMALSKRSRFYGALMVLDLDNFKPLNDLHGHLVGDLLLIEVARRLTSCVREIDAVGRFGGDEFLVILGALHTNKAESMAQAAAIAEKIRSRLAEPYWLTINSQDQPDTRVTHCCSASIGVMMFIDNTMAQGDILKCADAAMYQAKELGRNQVQFCHPD